MIFIIFILLFLSVFFIIQSYFHCLIVPIINNISSLTSKREIITFYYRFIIELLQAHQCCLTSLVEILSLVSLLRSFAELELRLFGSSGRVLGLLEVECLTTYVDFQHCTPILTSISCSSSDPSSQVCTSDISLQFHYIPLAIL